MNTSARCHYITLPGSIDLGRSSATNLRQTRAVRQNEIQLAANKSENQIKSTGLLLTIRHIVYSVMAPEQNLCNT